MALPNPPESTALERRSEASEVIDQPALQAAQSASLQSSTGRATPPRGARPSTPPSPSESCPAEMQAWTAPEIARFLSWADAQDLDLAMGWRLLGVTGMRRGEALALRWRDVDLDAGRLGVRRSVGVVKTTGASEQPVEGSTKTGRS